MGKKATQNKFISNLYKEADIQYIIILCLKWFRFCVLLLNLKIRLKKL